MIRASPGHGKTSQNHQLSVFARSTGATRRISGSDNASIHAVFHKDGVFAVGAECVCLRLSGRHAVARISKSVGYDSGAAEFAHTVNTTHGSEGLPQV